MAYICNYRIGNSNIEFYDDFVSCDTDLIGERLLEVYDIIRKIYVDCRISGDWFYSSEELELGAGRGYVLIDWGSRDV